MIRAMHDRILVEPFINSEFSEGGIYKGHEMTTFCAEKSKTMQICVGKVIDAGPGKYGKKGTRRAVEVPIGAWVVFSDTCGKPVTHEGKDYLFIREGDVVGFLPEPDDVYHVYKTDTVSQDSCTFNEG